MGAKDTTYLNEMELLLVDPHCNANVLLTEARTVTDPITAPWLGDLYTDPRVLLSDFFFVIIVVTTSSFANVVAVVIVLVAVVVVALALLGHLDYVLVLFWSLHHGKKTRL